MSEEDSDSHSPLQPMIPWKFTLAISIITVLCIIIVTFFTYSGAFPFQSPLGIYRLLPGDILLDFVWIYIITCAVGFIVYFLTPSMAVLFWRIHRVTKRESYNYYIQTGTGSPGISPVKRLITPAFTALGLSFSLSGSATQSLIFVTENFDTINENEIAVITAMPVLFISILISTVMLLVFAPVWLLDDSGLISEKKTHGSRDTANIEGVGHFFAKYLRGFAGISTVVAYVLTAIQVVEWYQFITSHGEQLLPTIVFLFPVSVIFAAPLIAMAPIALANIFYEKPIRKNSNAVVERFKKAGVIMTGPVEQTRQSS